MCLWAHLGTKPCWFGKPWAPLPITTQLISPVGLAELLGSEWSSELLCSSPPFSWTSWAGKCWFCHYSIRILLVNSISSSALCFHNRAQVRPQAKASQREVPIPGCCLQFLLLMPPSSVLSSDLVVTEGHLLPSGSVVLHLWYLWGKVLESSLTIPMELRANGWMKKISCLK